MQSLGSYSTKILIIIISSLFFCRCNKEADRYYTEQDLSIPIFDNIVIDNGFTIKDPVFNLNTYDNFLSYLSRSEHFLIVPLKDFTKTYSYDKVVISIRYDMDENIDAAVKFAYREKKYCISSSYFVLHTANYYGEKTGKSFLRNDNIIHYLKKIQNDFGHEIGFHNDLLTLQVVYGIPPKSYLKNELYWLRGNGINITGVTSHGSQYCYIYKYSNAYFWIETSYFGGNYEQVTKGFKQIKFEKDSYRNYNFEYEGGFINSDFFFTDVDFVNGKRWHMGLVNFDTICAGKKVIILLHPALWEL